MTIRMLQRRRRTYPVHGVRPFFEWTADDAAEVSQPTEPDPTPIDTPPEPVAPVDVPERGPADVPEPTPA